MADSPAATVVVAPPGPPAPVTHTDRVTWFFRQVGVYAFLVAEAAKLALSQRVLPEDGELYRTLLLVVQIAGFVQVALSSPPRRWWPDDERVARGLKPRAEQAAIDAAAAKLAAATTGPIAIPPPLPPNDDEPTPVVPPPRRMP